jgi:hypothetical protein
MQTCSYTNELTLNNNFVGKSRLNNFAITITVKKKNEQECSYLYTSKGVDNPKISLLYNQDLLIHKLYF